MEYTNSILNIPKKTKINNKNNSNNDEEANKLFSLVLPCSKNVNCFANFFVVSVLFCPSLLLIESNFSATSSVGVFGGRTFSIKLILS